MSSSKLTGTTHHASSHSWNLQLQLHSLWDLIWQWKQQPHTSGNGEGQIRSSLKQNWVWMSRIWVLNLDDDHPGSMGYHVTSLYYMRSIYLIPFMSSLLALDVSCVDSSISHSQWIVHVVATQTCIAFMQLHSSSYPSIRLNSMLWSPVQGVPADQQQYYWYNLPCVHLGSPLQSMQRT